MEEVKLSPFSDDMIYRKLSMPPNNRLNENTNSVELQDADQQNSLAFIH